MARRSTRTQTAKGSDIPSTVLRSDEHAQAIWAKTHDSAFESYGDGERAHRTAFSSLKHSYQKVGDHWEPKAERGPSDEQAARDTAHGSADGGPSQDRSTAGGVDARASKKDLLGVARRLGVPGRSRMRKAELVDAIGRANVRATARARTKG